MWKAGACFLVALGNVGELKKASPRSSFEKEFAAQLQKNLQLSALSESASMIHGVGGEPGIYYSL